MASDPQVPEFVHDSDCPLGLHPGKTCREALHSIENVVEHSEPVPFPPSTDVVEFVTDGDKVYLYCLICSQTLDRDVNYLNQAITVWRKHVEEKTAEAD